MAFWESNSQWRVELRNLREVQRRTVEDMRRLQGDPVVRGFRDAAMMMLATARKEAKVDRGMWRASQTPFVEQEGNVIRAGVGSNLDYGPFADLDTRPHWPPIDAIAEWVHRKRLAGTYSIKTRRRLTPKGGVRIGNVTCRGRMAVLAEDYQIAFLIARKIAKKGTKGDHSLEKGLEKNAERIIRRLERAIGEALGG